MMNIELKNLHKNFGSKMLFDDLSYIFSSQITVVQGESGCGKTTLLRMIAGLDKEYSGEILNVPGRMACVFQEDRLLPWKSIYDNLMFVCSELDEEEADRRINDVLKLFGIYESRYMRPEKLSGGMKRRVALARAYIYDADLLLLDEPFKGLNSEMKHQVADDFLAMIRDRGKTAVIVTHDEAIIKKADDAIVI